MLYDLTFLEVSWYLLFTLILCWSLGGPASAYLLTGYKLAKYARKKWREWKDSKKQTLCGTWADDLLTSICFSKAISTCFWNIQDDFLKDFVMYVLCFLMLDTETHGVIGSCPVPTTFRIAAHRHYNWSSLYHLDDADQRYDDDV